MWKVPSKGVAVAVALAVALAVAALALALAIVLAEMKATSNINGDTSHNDLDIMFVEDNRTHWINVVWKGAQFVCARLIDRVGRI